MTVQPDALQLEQLFGAFRAESLRDELYVLFKEPKYFYYLAAPKSCVLIGGRGSGKTTALKCMAYEGQAALNATDFSCPHYVGLYKRVDTNNVASFCGADLSQEMWRRLFTHFLNLSICEEAVSYIYWLRAKLDDPTVDSLINYGRIGRILGDSTVDTLDRFSDFIDTARVTLELYINNISGPIPTLSPLQTPINTLMDELRKLKGHSQTYFFIIMDEYENYLDYQQRIVNTLIKHSGSNVFYKIGVRELGWRERSTINSAELLISPADYERIRIEEALENDFHEFARAVCKSRLDAATLTGASSSLPVEQLLPDLSIREEALRLGVEDKIYAYRAFLRDQKLYELSGLHPHELYVFYELAGRDRDKATNDLRAFVAGEKSAKEKFDNYAYSLLFSIAGKGDEIRKYYSGHRVLSKLTFQNIRFYMQLVNACIREQFRSGHDTSTPIDPRLQTLAARAVGLSYLRELEGVSTQGGALARLLLGLGRVFQILAENPIGGKPECVQFEIQPTSGSNVSVDSDDLRTLVTEAVMHLALIRTPGTKLTTDSDIRSWDYAPHPIFAPYFCFSHRRKRKMSISEADLFALTKNPQPTIKKLLGRRSQLADEALPTQMSMFDEYFQ